MEGVDGSGKSRSEELAISYFSPQRPIGWIGYLWVQTFAAEIDDAVMKGITVESGRRYSIFFHGYRLPSEACRKDAD